jgi:hypothetical protein
MDGGRALAKTWARARDVLRSDAAVLGLCLLAWLPVVARMAMRLPVLPGRLGSDSADYLTLAAHRPPVYGWFLAAYQWTTGGLDYLPLAQLLVMAGALLLLAVELGRLLRSAPVAALAVLLVTRHVAIYDSPALIATESLFLAFVMAGLALACRHARQGGGATLAAASACFALAAATRTTGTALLLLPVLLALLDRRLAPRAAAMRAAACIGVAVLVLAVAVAGNWARHGRAEIGSFAGIALLGKALVLLEPADAELLPPATAATVPAAAAARQRIAAQPDLLARLRAHLQSSEDIRFAVFFPAAEAGWPAWRDATWRERSELGLALARQLIVRHPGGFAELWLRDWASLLLYPNYWPAWATADAADPRAFPACLRQNNCWALTRYDISPHWLAAMLAGSLGGAAVGLVLLPGAAGRVLRRGAEPVTTLCWGIALLLHASLLLSAFAEAGFSRYTAGPHVLGSVLLLWAVAMAARRPWRRRATRPGGETAAAFAITASPSQGQR